MDPRRDRHRQCAQGAFDFHRRASHDHFRSAQGDAPSDEFDEHALVEGAFFVELGLEPDEIGFDGAALCSRVGVVDAAMETDQTPFEMVGHQQEIVTPVFGEPREVVGLETAHHDAGPSIDLFVQGDEVWTQSAKLGGVGDAV